MTDGSITVNSCKGIAKMFNSFFKSIYVIDNSRDMPPHIIQNLSGDSLSYITVTECDVLAALRLLMLQRHVVLIIYLVGYCVSVLNTLLSDYYPI